MEQNYLNVFASYESEARSYCRKFPALFTTAKMSTMYDADGGEYIDFLCGAGALNFGHNNPVIRDAVIEYMQNDGITFSLDLHTEAKKNFLSAFSRNILEPRGLNYKMQFTSPSGTSAVESAVKLARKVKNRQNILCFTNGFHGMTAGSLSITGASYHRQNIAKGGVTRLPFDGYVDNFDTIAYYRKLLTDPSSGVDLPAAVILETVQGEGGVNVASIPWLQELNALCRELDILFIVDDIQAGCGRTGKFFSFERAGIEPDLVCLSKSIGGMGQPFAVLLLKEELDEWMPAEDNGTFRGNNLAFVAATKMLDTYWSNNSLENHMQSIAQTMADALASLAKEYPNHIKESRGLGFMQGLEFNKEEDAEAVAKLCFEQNLLIERCGPNDEVLKLMPACTIEADLVNKALEIIKNCVNKVCLKTTNSNKESATMS